MQRRNFLKGTLGTFVGTQIPWHSEQLAEPKEIVDKFSEHIRAFRLPENKLRQFRGVYVLDSGLCILLPPAESIEIKRTIYEHTYTVHWVGKEVEINQRLTIYGLLLFSDLRNLVLSEKFKYPRVIEPQDTVLCSFSLTSGFNPQSDPDTEYPLLLPTAKA